MESLSEEVWDVVIAGTSLPQSLLALALSRSGKKVLHVDRNDYYGGEDAGFSLQDAREWTKHLKFHKSGIFSDAFIEEPGSLNDDQHGSPLKSSRSYTLSLKPQIVYAQSKFLPTLVSSQIHSQLEFLAVGSWWVHRIGTLQKIPSTREDVFNDESLPMRDKRSLMKFLRFVLQEEGQEDAAQRAPSTQTLADALQSKYKISAALEAPIFALGLCPGPARATSLDYATARIQRHMRSVGYFGPGFGAVIAKYGGNAEISQVACRAQAVGGGTYLLGHGVKSVKFSSERTAEHSEHDSLVLVNLSDGTEVRSRWLVGGTDDLPLEDNSPHEDASSLHVSTVHSIDIVSDPLKHLFPVTAENGPVPAAAIVLVKDENDASSPPIYLQVHSEDTGDCPSGQCIIYGSVQSEYPNAHDILRAAVLKILHSNAVRPDARSLWRMCYTSRQPLSYPSFGHGTASPKVVVLPIRPHDISLQDETLQNIDTLWTAIMGSWAERHTFLRFEEREQEQGIES